MTEAATESATEQTATTRRLAILLAMAMFVLVVDTSLMNVSISAVVRDLHTTASGVQSAIALEALVSAAFILIGSKVGDLIGRKRAYVLGLLGYAIGALAMALAQSLTAIIIFWAIVGGLGASLLLPAMQSLIHGNFQGEDQKKAYALVGAAAAIAAAVGPLLGGFVTTYLSWRVGFLLEDLVIVVVLSGIKLVHDVPYTGSRHIDLVGALLSVLGMGGVVVGILVWQEGGESVAALLAVGVSGLAGLAYWLVRRKREDKPVLVDPDLFRSPLYRLGITGQTLQQIALGGTMIALPLYLQIVLEYNALQAGVSLAPLSLSMFAVALLAGKKAGHRRPSSIIRAGFGLVALGVAIVIPLVPRVDSGWYLAVPLLIAGSGLGLLVSQLNNYTLSPISEERVSEAAGVNSAGGLIRPVLWAGLRRGDHAGDAVGRVHQPRGLEHGALADRAAAGLQSAGARRRDREQHGARGAAKGRAGGDPRRDHPHQHARQACVPAGGAGDPAPRRSPWPLQLVPDDAPPGSDAVERGRRHGPRLTPAEIVYRCSRHLSRIGLSGPQ